MRPIYPDPASPDLPALADVATVVFAPAASGAPERLRVILADLAGNVACGTPALLATAERGTLLHLPCSQHGTGMFNAESLLAWRDGAWRPLEIESWTRELARRLPPGYGAWKGIYPDYARLTAVTPLWRDSDGNCCPTGGRAEIRLGWQGDRLRRRCRRCLPVRDPRSLAGIAARDGGGPGAARRGGTGGAPAAGMQPRHSAYGRGGRRGSRHPPDPAVTRGDDRHGARRGAARAEGAGA